LLWPGHLEIATSKPACVASLIFVVLASDAVWDVLSSQLVGDIVRQATLDSGERPNVDKAARSVFLFVGSFFFHK
jgi:serine/threonine protein phosphatase PrpC